MKNDKYIKLRFFTKRIFNMISDFDIDIKTRFLVLHLDAQMKLTRISDILRTSLRAIQDWTDKTDEGQDIIEVGAGRGNKPKVTSKLKQKNPTQCKRTA